MRRIALRFLIPALLPFLIMTAAFAGGWAIVTVNDLPEYAVAVDLYERSAHVQEYAPPKTIEPERAEARLRDVVAIVPEVLGVEAEEVYLKVRRRLRPGEQYGRVD